jgi:hypothetical protein
MSIKKEEKKRKCYEMMYVLLILQHLKENLKFLQVEIGKKRYCELKSRAAKKKVQ